MEPPNHVIVLTDLIPIISYNRIFILPSTNQPQACANDVNGERPQVGLQ